LSSNNTKAELAQSVLAVPHSRIREIADIAFRMEGVLSLYFGESNQPTPGYIKQAAVRALDAGFTFYTENAGLLSLREALAGYYRTMHRVSLDPRREIVITASGIQALNVAIRCVLDPGDEALILTPAWPNGASIVALSSARVVAIRQPLCADRDKRYEIDWEALEAAVTPRTRLLLYTSPSNPLGWVATREDQDRLIAFCRAHALWLIADEVYERLWFDGFSSGHADPGTPVPSILCKVGRDDAVIVIQSFSKSYCMTGWRVGWLVARADLAQKATHLNEFIVSHAPAFAQKAAETALADGEPEIAGMVERLRSNRDYCLGALRQMPRLTVPRPEGAFYLFPRVEGLTDSFEFCRRLLIETKVGLAPGVAFGAGGEGSIRICYAADLAVLEPAIDRLGRFLNGI
jgi:aspartate/methionine/tyrosine aminotransferase